MGMCELVQLFLYFYSSFWWIVGVTEARTNSLTTDLPAPENYLAVRSNKHASSHSEYGALVSLFISN